MTQSSANARVTKFVDAQDFLQLDAARGRLDKVINGEVTLSAIPSDSGTMQWEARTAEGKMLPMYGLTIQSDKAAFRGPVVIDHTEGVYVCYEDEAKQMSWCVKVRTN